MLRQIHDYLIPVPFGASELAKGRQVAVDISIIAYQGRVNVPRSRILFRLPNGTDMKVSQ